LRYEEVGSAQVRWGLPRETKDAADGVVLFTRREAGGRSLPTRCDDSGLLLHEHVVALGGEVGDLPGVCRVEVDPLGFWLATYLLDPRLQLRAEPPLLVLQLAGRKVLLVRALLEVEDKEQRVNVKTREVLVAVVLGNGGEVAGLFDLAGDWVLRVSNFLVPDHWAVLVRCL